MQLLVNMDDRSPHPPLTPVLAVTAAISCILLLADPVGGSRGVQSHTFGEIIMCISNENCMPNLVWVGPSVVELGIRWKKTKSACSLVENFVGKFI